MRLVLFSPKMVFVLANSKDPEEMQHFICVFTVCQSTPLGVCSLQRVIGFICFFLVKEGTEKVLLDILRMWGRFLCVTEAQRLSTCPFLGACKEKKLWNILGIWCRFSFCLLLKLYRLLYWFLLVSIL